MGRKHIYILLLYFLLALIAVPSVYGQSTSELELSDVVAAIGPRSGFPDLMWDIMLYLIFFFGLINMFVIPDKQLFSSILNFVVMGLAIVSKLLVGDNLLLEPKDLPVLILNVGMFTIPLIIAGGLRAVKGKPPMRMPSIVLGLLGGAYFFLYWALEQRV